MKITIETIPHSEQRYPTVGDWQVTPDGIIIRVSKMSDERYCALVAVHELVEVLLCRQNSVSTQVVDDFDKTYENRVAGTEYEYTEPGDHPQAPYKKEHCIATAVERLLCAELGVDWTAYDNEVNSL